MKLYFAPAACSMAPHIVLREAGYKFDLVRVDTAKRQTADGQDYSKINPNGYVPALQLDNGEVLTEAAVILQYLADQKPEAGLAPKPGTMERYRLMEWLNFISSELHKSLGQFFKFKSTMTPEWKESVLGLFSKRCDFVVEKLAGKSYVMGDRFSVADAYLYTVLGWPDFPKIDMSRWPTIKDYRTRVTSRPVVRETLVAEGLIK
jgi:glutathione S-transferase